MKHLPKKKKSSNCHKKKITSKNAQRKKQTNPSKRVQRLGRSLGAHWVPIPAPGLRAEHQQNGRGDGFGASEAAAQGASPEVPEVSLVGICRAAGRQG